MSIKVNRIGESISGSVNMKPFGIKYTEAKYDQMKALELEASEAETMEELNGIIEVFNTLTVEDFKEMVETECEFIFVNESTGKFYLKNGDVISNRELPKAFVERILNSIDLGIDFMPIIKAWTRFMRNPNYSDFKASLFANYLNKTYMDADFRDELINDKGITDEVATERATQFQVAITMEGLICTYKKSREIDMKFDAKTGELVPRYEVTFDEDTGEASTAMPEHVEDRVFQPSVMGDRGDAFTCEGADGTIKKGHHIRIGARHYLDSWKQVNCNDFESCVPGLHVGNLDYIRGYSGENHYTFVDPMNIGAITDDGSGAIRVLEYFTYGSFVGPNRSIYHSSRYASMTDAQWEILREEAIKNAEELMEDIDGEVAEINSY